MLSKIVNSSLNYNYVIKYLSILGENYITGRGIAAFLNVQNSQLIELSLCNKNV